MHNLADEIRKELSAARGVQDHKSTLRVQFKVPDRDKPIRKSIELPVTLQNIEFAKHILAEIKADIQNRLYANDPEFFWKKHFPNASEAQTQNITVRTCFLEYIEKIQVVYLTRF